MRSMIMVLLLCALGMAVFLAVKGCGRSTASDMQEVRIRTMLAELVPLFELTPLESRVSGIVEVERNRWPRFLRGSRCVLIVRGVARYGIDLGESRLSLHGQETVLELPLPRVTAAWVDMEQSRTWERRSGVLVRSERLDDDQEAWRRAVEMVRESAAQPSHVRTAQLQAEQAIGRFASEMHRSAPLRIRWREEQG